MTARRAVVVAVWGHDFAACDDWTPIGHGYDTPRAARLYEALQAPQDDDEYVLCAHADGRWALIGLTVQGHEWAYEVTP